jgi:predicted metallo-beta-lactamase superfamily hydrolase
LIKITPLASESLGVRSLAVFVETPDIKILLDAGVALAPRFGKLPHPLEYGALKEARERIRKHAQKADLITITHYHFDHYTQTWDEVEPKFTWSSYHEAEQIYANKQICAKHIQNMINYSQRKRGYVFSKVAKKFVDKIEYIDTAKLEFGSTKIQFSKPLPHGEDGTPLGYVLALTIHHDNDTMLFGSDIQGPISDQCMQYILKQKPSVMAVSGPPTYLAGTKVNDVAINNGLKNLFTLTKTIKHIIVDHHLLRELKSLDVVNELKQHAEKHGNKVSTYAEYLGQKNNLLEAMREELYQRYPPDQEFEKWSRRVQQKQTSEIPPL